LCWGSGLGFGVWGLGFGVWGLGSLALVLLCCIASAVATHTGKKSKGSFVFLETLLFCSGLLRASFLKTFGVCRHVVDFSWDFQAAGFQQSNQTWNRSFLKRTFAEQHFIKDNSQRPHVGFGIVTLVFQYFRSHVYGTAHHCLSELMIGDWFAEPKVAYFYGVFIEHYVRWLDVSVQNVEIVQINKSRDDFRKISQRFLLS
jgi:hypothetical protein